ncbi:nitrogen permease regulator of amino acid transport activity 3-domain-containing protein [Tribonema minus]|uniref:Nitrogen permease regulator of amino acid transport activity 3-domain-containing protein n=1 Tax=Tribonema minus TaxID=303371 RepID=A0A835Z9L1_9STRA|nr:nitrogen permease regulator of amino acid transport activity 3-domain-containing protein [Tribonema minus]
MIIGIALVVDDISKGQRLVFRYPPKEQRPLITGTVDASVAANTAAEFHSIDSDTFAKLFRPKSILCKQTLEVVIDQIRHVAAWQQRSFALALFISYPTEVKFEAAHGCSSAQDHRSGGDGGSSGGGDGGGGRDMIFFNVVIALTATPVERVGQLQQALPLYAGGDAEDSGRHRTHHNQIKAMLHQERRCGYVKLAAFRHAVAAKLSAVMPHEERAAVAANLSAAMLHEERRCGYVSREVHAMLAIREQQHQAQKQMLSKVGGQPHNGTKHDHIEDCRELVDAMLEASALARDLREVYHGLARGTGAHIRLNDWISLNFRTVEGGSRVRPWTAYAPFETLLLVEDEDKRVLDAPRTCAQAPFLTRHVDLDMVVDEDKVLAALPAGSSPQLLRLISAANPLRSFEELSSDLEIPLAQVYQLSSHLVYWGRGRVIDTIAMTNIYQVTAGSDIGHHSRSSAAFRLKFPRQSLAQTLAQFSSGQSLQEVLQSTEQAQRLQLLQMVVWLLQHGFLVQLREYLALAVPQARASGGGDILPRRGSGLALASRQGQPVQQQQVQLPSSAQPRRPLWRSTQDRSGLSADSPGSTASSCGNLQALIQQAPKALNSDEEDYLEILNDGSRLYSVLRTLCAAATPAAGAAATGGSSGGGGSAPMLADLRTVIWAEGLDAAEVAEACRVYEDVLAVSLRPRGS